MKMKQNRKHGSFLRFLSIFAVLGVFCGGVSGCAGLTNEPETEENPREYGIQITLQLNSSSATPEFMEKTVGTTLEHELSTLKDAASVELRSGKKLCQIRVVPLRQDELEDLMDEIHKTVGSALRTSLPAGVKVLSIQKYLIR